MTKRFHLKDLSLEEFNSIGKLPGQYNEDSYYQYQHHRRYFILKERISNFLSKNNEFNNEDMDVEEIDEFIDDKFEFIRLCKNHKLPMIFRFE